MKSIQDFIIVNKLAIKGLVNNLKMAPQILLVGLLFYSGTMLVSLLVGVLLIAGIPSIILSLLSFIVKIYIGLIFLRSIDSIVEYSRFKLSDVSLYAKDRMMFSKIGMLFVLGNVLSLIISLLPMGNMTGTVTIFINVLLVIMFNALPETLYAKNYDPIGSLKYTANFMVENWITWLIPTIIITILYNFSLGLTDFYNMQLNIFTINPFISPRLFTNLGIYGWVRFVATSIILFLFMVYRGHLFKILSGTSQRTRMFNYYNKN